MSLFLEKLSLLNFKNHVEIDFDLDPDINAFCGKNGAGKTNILDAIYALCHTKSFLNPTDSNLIRFEQDYFLLQGKLDKNTEKHQISLGYKKGQKKRLKLNSKNIERFASFIGFIPAVVIAPSDRDLIHEGSEFRRKFFDSILSIFDNQYLEDILDYALVLKNRNALLKKMQESRNRDFSYLEIWDEKMVALSERILPKRIALLEEFNPLFKDIYKDISGVDEAAEIIYQGNISENGLLKDLIEARDKDLRLGYSSVGLHKDDMQFSLDGKAVKKFGSQGQQKTFLLALKLTNYQILSQHTGLKPLLLLDDLFDKLDASRVTYLLKLISDERFGQIFISHTSGDELAETLGQASLKAKIFEL